jgi:integrase
MSRDELPRGVFPKGKRYYLVTAEGKRRIWHKLSRIDEGLPALYVALAKKKLELARDPALVANMPALIGDWELEVMPAHAAKTQVMDRFYNKGIATAFKAWTPEKIDAPACSTFLAEFKHQPRTFNAYRGQLRELLRFAEEKGRRAAGTNPLDAIRTMKTPPRGRYITDSELRRIKVAAIDRRESITEPGRILENESGRMLCALIDMAYLTGQAIGDLLELEWKDITDAGIYFARNKVAKTTGSRVIIEWTPRLEELVGRLRTMRKARRGFGAAVFVKGNGEPYTYYGVSSAWMRSRDRAGVIGCTFHDIKAKALTDKEDREGMRAASAMGQHATESQTSDYIRRKKARKTGATR